MTFDRRSALALVVSGFCLLSAARADPWSPDHAITLMVPFPPGGQTDAVARIVGEQLARRLGQPVAVENRLGLNGSVAAEAVARAAPDGHALVMSGMSALAANPLIDPRVRYDARKDFTHVALLTRTGLVLLASPEVRGAGVRAVIAHARARPGSIDFALTRIGLSEHLATELFRQAAGVEMRTVPYRGEAPAFADLLDGRVDLLFASVAAAVPHVRSGRLRALAVTSLERNALLPGVPTMAESGLPAASADTWTGVAGPAGLPSAVVSRLNRECTAILEMPEVRERLAEQGLAPMPGTPKQAAAFVEGEVDKWARVVKAGRIRAD